MLPVRYHHGLLLAEASGIRVCAGPQEPSRQALASANAQAIVCRSQVPVTILRRSRRPPGSLDPRIGALLAHAGGPGYRRRGPTVKAQFRMRVASEELAAVMDPGLSSVTPMTE